jgi:hypothetical protein
VRGPIPISRGWRDNLPPGGITEVEHPRVESAASMSSNNSRMRAILRPGLTLLGLACLAGCRTDDASGVKGARSDVKTVPGVYDGFEVLDECQLPSIPYGVLGTGSSWYRGVAPGEPSRFDAVRELGNSVLAAAFADLQSIDGIGVGTSCTLDSGVMILMSDWREVDAVLERSGRILAEQDLREEVSVSVGVAVPH